MNTPTENGAENIQDDLVEQKPTSKPSKNPFAHAANISVSVPETVEVKLVDASALADYEVWVLLTSILSSVSAGFVVAAIQSSGKPEQATLIAISVVWIVLTLVCALTAKSKRAKISAKARRLKFAVGEPVE